MKSYTIRRVPWTCECRAASASPSKSSLPANHASTTCSGRATTRAGNRVVRVMKRGECERCPFWMEAARLRLSS